MQIVSNYSEVKQLMPEGVRGLVRNLALDALALLNTSNSLATSFAIPRVHFLYIHHVFQDEEEQFRKLLQQLSVHHTFISYSEAVRRIHQGNIDKPYMVFSSDDGFKNNLRAVKILNEFGAKACFFINPDIVGEKDPLKIQAFCDRQLMFPMVDFMDWKDIEFVLASGHEIGAHTMNHINVAASSKELIEEDMQLCRQVILEKCGQADHFAFPYGRFFHFNEEGRKACFNAGFISCASAERGAHVAGNHPLAPEKLLIRRDHLVLGWKLSHLLYFVSKSATSASIQNDFYPYTT